MAKIAYTVSANHRLTVIALDRQHAIDVAVEWNGGQKNLWPSDRERILHFLEMREAHGCMISIGPISNTIRIASAEII